MPATSTYVNTLSPTQISDLHAILQNSGWSFDQVPYAHWRAKKDKVNVVAYQSGKLTAQGQGFADFVQFILEPNILHEARFGYENELAAVENPQMFQPHAGIDESGKGDFFGPLVIACCYTNKVTAQKFLQAGVADSKTIGGDKAIARLAQMIQQEAAGQYAIVTIGPESYNRLYGSFQNLNRLLGWGHAKSLENLLEKVPDCPRAISDQFGNPVNVRRALQERGKRITLEQHPKAEADIAVAAASILARNEFVRYIEKLTNEFGIQFPKGASPAVKAAARDFCKKYGREQLGRVAKLHFKTAEEI